MQSRRGVKALAFGAALLVGLAAQGRLDATQVPPGFRDQRLVSGLDLPVACEFAPDGRLFILLKGGEVRIYKDHALLPDPALTLAVNSASERGLLGLAFDPKFARNGFIYLYYTTAEASPHNRVSRFVAQGDRIDPASERILVDGIRSDAGFHNGGCLRFGPDRKLYVSTGDGGSMPQLAQDLGSINGKILRINRGGGIPPSNPFVGQPGARGEVWCYGLRNPWRFSFDPAGGLMLIGDVGRDIDEIDVGQPGHNYGWPIAEGPSNNPAFTNPIYSYTFLPQSNALIGGIVYRGENFPVEYQGVYFFGDYEQGFIRYLELTSANTVAAVREFATDVGGIVHLTSGPDGALYYVTLEGRIRRIFYRR